MNELFSNYFFSFKIFNVSLIFVRKTKNFHQSTPFFLLSFTINDGNLRFSKMKEILLK